MNINQYNKNKKVKKDNSKVTSNKNPNNKQFSKKKKRIRLDRLIGYITIITIIVFSAIIYNDIKSVGKSTNEEVIAEKSGQTTTNVTGTPAQSSANNNKIVCIDAGHGGTDGGAQYFGYTEKNQTLEIAMLVKKNLEDKGITVVMTRTTDITVSLEKRLEIAKAANAGMLISIHRNYYDRSVSVSGVEAWINSTEPKDAKSLATNILTQLSKIDGVNNRGTKSGSMNNENTDYYLNSQSTSTSCIIELGFITNTTDNVLVVSNKNQCSKSIAQGIINYINELEKQ